MGQNTEEVGAASAIADLLAQHEARWTTHGWERTYQVMHCAGDCDWRLRQKALMSDDDCFEKHRRHVAEQIAAMRFPPATPDVDGGGR